VAGVTFSDFDSAPVQKFLNPVPGPATFLIRESDSCSDSGYNHRCNRGEYGQDQDWISSRILAIFWIRIVFGYLFLKKTGSGQDQEIGLIFYNEITLRVIQDVTNDGSNVFFAVAFIFTKNQNDFVSMCRTHHNQ